MKHIPKPPKRNKRVPDQQAYYEAGEWDEFELARGAEVPRTQVHEILHGSRKQFEPWNMILLSYENHERAHKRRSPTIFPRDLFVAKAENMLRTGGNLADICPPADVIREFSLEDYYAG